MRQKSPFLTPDFPETTQKSWYNTAQGFRAGSGPGFSSTRNRFPEKEQTWRPESSDYTARQISCHQPLHQVLEGNRLPKPRPGINCSISVRINGKPISACFFSCFIRYLLLTFLPYALNLFHARNCCTYPNNAKKNRHTDASTDNFQKSQSGS